MDGEKLDNERVSLRKFNRYFILGHLVSLGLEILGFIFINDKQDNFLQIAGWIFIVLGIVFFFIFMQRRKRLLWVYKNSSPTPMKMTIEKNDDSDSTNYFAYLTRRDSNTSESWKTRLYPPSFNLQMFLGNENQVEVFIDPKNNNPAVIRTAEGLLWVMAGSGSVERLQ